MGLLGSHAGAGFGQQLPATQQVGQRQLCHLTEAGDTHGPEHPELGLQCWCQ